MNTPIRPAPAAASLGPGSLLPAFATGESAGGQFNSLLEDRLLAPGKSAREPSKKGNREEPEPPERLLLEAGVIPPLVVPPVLELPVAAELVPASFPTSPDGSSPGPETRAPVAPLPSPTMENARPASPEGEAPSSGEIVLPEFSPVSEAEARELLARYDLETASKQARNGQKTAGMPAAQQERMLSHSQKLNEFAAEPEQKVPGSGSFLAVPRLEVEFRPSPVITVPLKHPALALENSAGMPGLITISSGFEQGATVEFPHTTPVQESPDIPLLDAIREHIQSIRSGGADSLEVTLSPEAGTELLLRVEKIEGEIHVRLRFERGDFAALESQWPQIQQALAAQGIKAESLDSGAGGYAGQPDRHDRQESGEETRSSANQPPPHLKPVAGTPKPRATVPAVDGWQSWA